MCGRGLGVWGAGDAVGVCAIVYMRARVQVSMRVRVSGVRDNYIRI